MRATKGWGGMQIQKWREIGKITRRISGKAQEII